MARISTHALEIFSLAHMVRVPSALQHAWTACCVFRRASNSATALGRSGSCTAFGRCKLCLAKQEMRLK